MSSSCQIIVTLHTREDYDYDLDYEQGVSFPSVFNLNSSNENYYSYQL